MIIPWQRLSEEALNNVLESFVLREGTDYGEVEKTLDEKVDDLKRQLVNNEIAIFWSELHNSLDLRRL